MNTKEYKGSVRQYSRKIGLRKKVLNEILKDLQEFVENTDDADATVVEKLGQPTEFVDQYIENGDLKKLSLYKLFHGTFEILIYICALFFSIFMLCPFIWLVAFIFRLPVEIGYGFQFVVGMVLFAIGSIGLHFLKKKNWL
ncbi:hypothetical protein [Pediococcus acidilactici]|uniref:hypothetical protein n=1 Tax=Pediococcus acidilactici TaxID=1254 RepID=UPI001CCDB2CB|nr:hypothetical protein [Pediococcus acidilactici]MCH9266062.1 hypothetical protein [Pediococcus acidilactici]MCK2073200.1 hypothetical protein [Pediococcus acidilactici]MDV2602956.1 hypothetical protein [Pediococcus acidilactici]MDV2844378.1 hypothetical protein [Pediococcus acidilactici]WQS22055.1 hypothetical protein SGW15_08070 [Pediococcus acidilactici]